MRRRDFTKLALAGAAGAVTATAVVRAQAATFNWKHDELLWSQRSVLFDRAGSAKDLIKRIEDMSGGRIKIQFYGAGELIPAAEGFDARFDRHSRDELRQRVFLDRKVFAGQYFTAVPFGLNFQGLNGWMYDAVGCSSGRRFTPLQLGAVSLRQHRCADDRLVQETDREG